jgi:FAD:protein FMN transferase
VSGRDFAVATSGTAERGARIVDPHTGERAGELASVTVVGRSLTRVDAYATAAFVMGQAAVAGCAPFPRYDGLVVSAEGAATSTPGSDGRERT